MPQHTNISFGKQLERYVERNGSLEIFLGPFGNPGSSPKYWLLVYISCARSLNTYTAALVAARKPPCRSSSVMLANFSKMLTWNEACKDVQTYWTGFSAALERRPWQSSEDREPRGIFIVQATSRLPTTTCSVSRISVVPCILLPATVFYGWF